MKICVDAGWPFRRWTEFVEIDVTERTLDGWRQDATTLPDRARVPSSVGLRPGARASPWTRRDAWPPPPEEPSEVVG